MFLIISLSYRPKSVIFESLVCKITVFLNYTKFLHLEILAYFSNEGIRFAQFNFHYLRKLKNNAPQIKVTMTRLSQTTHETNCHIKNV